MTWHFISILGPPGVTLVNENQTPFSVSLFIKILLHAGQMGPYMPSRN